MNKRLVISINNCRLIRVLAQVIIFRDENYQSVELSLIREIFSSSSDKDKEIIDDRDFHFLDISSINRFEILKLSDS